MAQFVSATQLHKSFDGQPAVNGFSLTIDEGEIFGLLGPNGAGKTTTIRMLATVLAPDAGDAHIGGHSIVSAPREVRRIIGLCPQDIALYEDMSARDNLLFFGRMGGLTLREARTRAVECLETVNLTARADERVARFSGGMKRRVNLAIALVNRPRLLFLDEPTVGVDPQSRASIYDTIRALAHGGTTVLYTTHYIEEAENLCSRVAIIDAGRIIALDTPEGLHGLLPDAERPTLEDVFLHLTGRTLRDV